MSDYLQYLAVTPPLSERQQFLAEAAVLANAAGTGYALWQLRAQDRTTAVVNARFCLMLLLQRAAELKPSQIGQVLNRDRGSIANGLGKARAWLETYPSFCDLWHRVMAEMPRDLPAPVRPEVRTPFEQLERRLEALVDRLEAAMARGADGFLED